MDITDRKTQEKQLLISEKLAATGRLAATIAHEINNPLEAVFNLIYLARTSRTDIEKIRGYLATAEREITRVSHIARHTLGFYRDSSQRETIQLPALIDRCWAGTRQVKCACGCLAQLRTWETTIDGRAKAA